MLSDLTFSSSANDNARHLLPYLVSLPPAERPAFIRLVDKPLVIPAANAYTTYVDTACREAFKKGTQEGIVEYVQGNLLTEGEYVDAMAGRAVLELTLSLLRRSHENKGLHASRQARRRREELRLGL